MLVCLLQDMQRYVGEELLSKSQQGARAPAGEPWVRGWDDYKQPETGAKSKSADGQADQAAAVSGDQKLA